MNGCVIIPTFNEEKSIGGIVKRILRLNLTVVVIDDGSLDNTTNIAQKNGAIIIRNFKNEGKGASLIKGFNYALQNNFDKIITLDGDGQHIPEDILRFIRAAENTEKTLYIGNRMSSPQGMPLVRQLTNIFMSWFLSLIIGQKIPDTQCGFRLISKDLLLRLKLVTERYETESEILIKAAQLGYKIESVPINTIYRGERSQINPFLDTFRFIKFILKIIFEKNYKLL